MENTYSTYAEKWFLDKNCIFLNHGSFGACPIEVLEEYHTWQKRIEEQPVKFFMRTYREELHASKLTLSSFLDVASDDLVFVRNATEGINTVLHSIQWKQGDEIIITNHIYPACKNAVQFYSTKFGLQITEIQIPFPLQNTEEIITPILNAVKSNTRLLLLDHITSPTGLLFPIKEISKFLIDSNVLILIDGAHAPGAISLNISDLGVDFYTGNCHKWMCAPKGAGFLWVHPDQQQNIYPLNISLINTLSDTFTERFFWTGTQDPSAWLSIPSAISFLNQISQNDISSHILHIQNMNKRMRSIVCNMLDTPLPCPDDMITTMSAIPVKSDSSLPHHAILDPMQDWLMQHYQIEVPIINWPNSTKRLLRFSFFSYNTLAQYTTLAEAIIMYYKTIKIN